TGRALVATGPQNGKGYVVYRDEHASGEADPGEVREAVHQLEQNVSLVVAELPALDHPYTTALLSPQRAVVLAARAGLVTRGELRDAADALERAGVPTAGIVLSQPERNGKRRA